MWQIGTIVRIEHKTIPSEGPSGRFKLGPYYRDKISIPSAQEMQTHVWGRHEVPYYVEQEHPDFKFNPNLFCGFKDIKSLTHWFTISTLRELNSLDFILRVFQGKVYHAEHQSFIDCLSEVSCLSETPLSYVLRELDD